MNDPFLTNKRNKDIYELRQEGATYESIATKYGVTRERIRQVVYKYERKLSHIRNKALSGTQNTVHILRTAELDIFYFQNYRRKYKNDDSDDMLRQELKNLIEIYSEVL